MRYWAYLVGKVVAAAGPMYGLYWLVWKIIPPSPRNDSRDVLLYLYHDFPRYFMLMAWFVLCAGVFALILWDQRRRCRVCLHLLRMPVETGSWGYMLQLGRPRIEYICPYGHGTLKQDELQIDGLASPEWKRNSDDIWGELCASIVKDPKDS